MNVLTLATRLYFLFITERGTGSDAGQPETVSAEEQYTEEEGVLPHRGGVTATVSTNRFY